MLLEPVPVPVLVAGALFVLGVPVELVLVGAGAAEGCQGLGLLAQGFGLLAHGFGFVQLLLEGCVGGVPAFARRPTDCRTAR